MLTSLMLVLKLASASLSQAAPAQERFPEVAPLGASGMLRVDADANDDECAQY